MLSSSVAFGLQARLAVSMPAMKTLMETCSTVAVIPMSRRSPVTACPHPVVIQPSPIATDPDVAGSRTTRHDLNHGSRHWGWDDDRSRGDYDRGRQGDSQVDAEPNSRIGGGDCQSCQGQNCDCLFHNLYCFDGAIGQDSGINPFRCCNRRRGCPPVARFLLVEPPRPRSEFDPLPR